MNDRLVYLDNAATTPLAPEVIQVITSSIQELYGNPSSIHSEGRKVRSAIERARKSVARLIGCSPAEVFFTSGGTEADNMAIHCAIRDLGITQVVSSPLEHHAVLHTLQTLAESGAITLQFVRTDSCGRVDLGHLEELLKGTGCPALVSLMHANNETGTLLDLVTTGEICRRHKAVFHSDTVQTVGHYHFNLQELPVDIITCAAHKFHGPKGVGFIFVRGNLKLKALIEGGSQERNMRGGTENVYGILGLAKALELAMENLLEQTNYVQELKDRMTASLSEKIPGVEINGCSQAHESLYTVLNVSLPNNELGDMLLFNLDINGICASGGSACSSGSSIGSHVLSALGVPSGRPSVRFSFSHYTTSSDVDYAAGKLAQLAGFGEAQAIPSYLSESPDGI